MKKPTPGLKKDNARMPAGEVAKAIQQRLDRTEPVSKLTRRLINSLDLLVV